MDDLFDYFNVDKSLYSKKKELKVFLMGTFYPNNLKNRLKLLRRYLTEKEYDARLAEDFEYKPNADKDVFLWCRYLILNWANARILVFFEEALDRSKILGVYDEFAIATENIPLEEQKTCALFLEESIDESYLSRMTRGRLENFDNFRKFRFSNDLEMNEMAARFCFELLYKMNLK